MAKVQIDIPGVGLVTAENAASESTLRELVNAIGGAGGGTGGGSTGGGSTGGGMGGGLAGIAGIAGLLGMLGRNSKVAGNAVGGLAGAIGSASSGAGRGLFGAIGGAIKGVFKFGGALAGFALGAVTNFAKQLIFGENNLQTLVSMIPIVGKHLQGLAGILDTTLNTYRQLSEIGASFGNNMFGFMQSAIRAEMSLTDFATFVSQNTESLAIMGGSVTEGARRFADLSKGMRTSGIAEQLFNMGFSIEELNDGLTSFYEENARSGRIRRMSDAEIVQGAQEYAIELDRLAKLTGMSRREAARSRLEVLSDAKIRNMASKLEGQARENFITNMTMINRSAPGMAQAFDDLADGVAQTDVGRQLMVATQGRAADVARLIAEGADPEVIRSALSELGPVIDQFRSQYTDAQLQAMQTNNPALYAMLSGAQELTRMAESSARVISEEQNAGDKFTAFMTNLEQSMQSFKSQILDTFVNSGLFEKLTGMFNNLDISGNTAKEMFDKLKPAIEGTINWFDGFLDSFSNIGNEQGGGPVDYITNSVNDMLRGMFDVQEGQTLGGAAQEKMTEWFEGTMDWLKTNALPPAEKVGEYVSDALGFVWEKLKEVMTPSLSNVVGVALAGIGATILALTAPVSVPIAAGIAAVTGFLGMFTGFFDDVGNSLSNFSITETVGRMWSSIVDMFSFDFELPSFSDYLPTWLGGEGKPLSDLFSGGGSSSTTSVASAGPTVDTTAPDLGTVTQNQQAIQQTNSEIATAAQQLAASSDTQKNIETLLKDLNTTMLAILDVNDRSDRTFDRVRRNLALNYNLG